MSIDFHTKWRGLRASLMELVFTDADVRRFYRSQRRRQLDESRKFAYALDLRQVGARMMPSICLRPNERTMRLDRMNSRLWGSIATS